MAENSFEGTFIFTDVFQIGLTLGNDLTYRQAFQAAEYNLIARDIFHMSIVLK